jgi:hypothetical protein
MRRDRYQGIEFTRAIMGQQSFGFSRWISAEFFWNLAFPVKYEIAPL